MPTLAISNLSGVLLDRAVLAATGWHYDYKSQHYMREGEFYGLPFMDLRYSQRWDLIGPLMDKYKININFVPGEQKWYAYAATVSIVAEQSDFDPLVAVARAYLFLASGPTVELDIS